MENIKEEGNLTECTQGRLGRDIRESEEQEVLKMKIPKMYIKYQFLDSRISAILGGIKRSDLLLEPISMKLLTRKTRR